MKKKFMAVIKLTTAISIACTIYTMAQSTITHAAKNNDNGQQLQVKMSEDSGCYPETFSLEITCKGAGKIYYTTDGSNPALSDTRKEYTGAIPVTDRKNETNILAATDPVLFDCAYSTFDGTIGNKYSAPADNEVDKAVVIKAVATDASGTYTDVVTNTYFVGNMAEHIQGIEESCKAAGIPLAIMSISMDSKDLFDYETGIYVKGKTFDEAFRLYSNTPGTPVSDKNIVDISRKLEANYTQKGSEWERPAHIDYLESDGISTVCKLQQDCGIRMQGNYSRSDMQKGFRLYARNSYGKKNFNYPFFGESLKDNTGATKSKFKKLVLRNGGNAAFIAKYNDSFWQSLLKGTNCGTQASRACIVYLDGEYWGIYILQEEYDDNYFEDTYGVNKDEVVVYKGDAEKYECGYKLEEGTLPDKVTDESYYLDELTNFFKTHENLINEEDYNEFTKLVDVDSIRDYFAAQIWIDNKWDWPGKNWTMWKVSQTNASNPYADGRWRLCFYDLDFGGVSGGSSAYDNTVKTGNYKEYGLLDMSTDNPVVLCYAFLMSNPGFRDSFKQRILEFNNGIFAPDTATNACQVYKDTCQPLYLQYFTRFFGKEEAGGFAWNAVSGGYGSYSCITEFIKNRSGYIPDMLKWVDTFYASHTIYNSDLAKDNIEQTEKTITPFTVTAKKGKTSIKIKTLKQSKVTISLSKKIIKSGKKTVNKLVIQPENNNTGNITIKLSGKLKKGIKVTVTVSKTGYKTKHKTVSIK